jgi:hypothetical protein
MAFNSRLLQGQYVAFAKVTTAIWKNMQSSDKLKNTLYFVVDGDTDDVGQLYLGETLIADGSGVSQAQLSDLSDVQLKAISSGDTLVYNLETQVWENVNLSQQIQDQIKVFTGATETTDGAVGLVPQPAKSVDVNHYLRGDGTWADPTNGVDLSSLKSQVSTLIGDDTDKSVHEIVTEAIATVVDGADEQFDTLKEIADWILDHPDVADIKEMQTTVSTLSTDVSNLKTVVGDSTSGLVANVTSLGNTVGNLESEIADLQAQDTKIIATVSEHTTKIETLENAIEERLTWHQIEEVTE